MQVQQQKMTAQESMEDARARKKLGFFAHGTRIVHSEHCNRELERLFRQYESPANRFFHNEQKDKNTIFSLGDGYTNMTNADVLYAFAQGYDMATSNSWHEEMDSRVSKNGVEYWNNMFGLISLYTEKKYFGHAKKIVLVSNPFFAINKIVGSHSHTRDYLEGGNKDQKHLNTLKNGIKLFGKIGKKTGEKVSEKVVEGIEVGVNLRSAYSTHGHLQKFRQMLSSDPDNKKSNQTIDVWLDIIIQQKELKRKIRLAKAGCQVGSVAVNATVGVVAPPLVFISGLATSLLTEAVIRYLKSGKATLEFSCMVVAIQLHWRAYQEQKIANAPLTLHQQEGFTPTVEGIKAAKEKLRQQQQLQQQAKSGPATRILKELFSNRGKYMLKSCNGSIDQLIQEPAGWLAITDRLVAL